MIVLFLEILEQCFTKKKKIKEVVTTTEKTHRLGWHKLFLINSNYNLRFSPQFSETDKNPYDFFLYSTITYLMGTIGSRYFKIHSKL